MSKQLKVFFNSSQFVKIVRREEGINKESFIPSKNKFKFSIDKFKEAIDQLYYK